MKNELIYDKRGLPSMMVTITLEEIIGKISGEDCPAFIVDGRQINEISISKYPNVIIDGLAYSLPVQEPATLIDFDTAVKVCEDKGPGWHLMTNAEWAALARWCRANGTIPHGNTNYGSYHGDLNESGVKVKDSGKTLTGSGPATFSHDHTTDGIYDLCGNVWEWVGGVRWLNGELQIIPNNNAAAGVSQAADSKAWQPVKHEGRAIKYRAADDTITVTTNDIEEPTYDGCAFSELSQEIEAPEILKQLALYPNDGNQEDGYFWLDSEGERLAARGGDWNYGAYAGVFSLNGYNPRSYVRTDIGFRSAYIRPSEICQSDNLSTDDAETTLENETPAFGEADLEVLARAVRAVAGHYGLDPDEVARIATELGKAMLEVGADE